ncbi:hypothetical protein GRX01_01680 [Halobaculum sp. WSA2]|uniref:Type II methyltransferase n=1 Tax=Halobaculum saliterrae TaxID=2073113 RepID=A0A6B0STS8_9EURY|nr:site-specific DNA-methyltransferase [Halobaculum saliterrae]MXR40071.1 hypothetical protein [Halobaculum saliterrae]
MLTDPPYNLSSNFEADFPSRSSISHDFGEWDDNQITPNDWVPEIARILNDNGTLITFYNNRRTHELLAALTQAGLEFRQKAYWHKTNPVPQLYGVKWQEAVEEIIIATVNEGKGHGFQDQRGQHHNVIHSSIQNRGPNTDHPTQKPEEVISTLIKWWTKPEDLVVDPFAGSGTVCVVAQQLGRQYLGIEQKHEYVETARTRLNQRSLQQDW